MSLQPRVFPETSSSPNFQRNGVPSRGRACVAPTAAWQPRSPAGQLREPSPKRPPPPQARAASRTHSPPRALLQGPHGTSVLNLVGSRFSWGGPARAFPAENPLPTHPSLSRQPPRSRALAHGCRAPQAGLVQRVPRPLSTGKPGPAWPVPTEAPQAPVADVHGHWLCGSAP